MPNSRPDLPDPIPDDGPILPDAKEQEEIAWATKYPGWAKWLPWIAAVVVIVGGYAIWVLAFEKR